MQSGHPVSPRSRGSTRRPTRCSTAGKGRGRVPQIPRPRAAVYLGRGAGRGRPTAPLPPSERWGILPAQDPKSTKAPTSFTRPTTPHSVWSRAPRLGVRDSSPRTPPPRFPAYAGLQKLRLSLVLLSPLSARTFLFSYLVHSRLPLFRHIRGFPRHTLALKAQPCQPEFSPGSYRNVCTIDLLSL